jgi:phospholipase/carboxylesterase
MSEYTNEPKTAAEGCVIWLHGLGADASDMKGLVEQFPNNQLALRHVFLDAPVRPVTLNNNMPMRAWYDITGLTLSAREDQAGISQSEILIRNIVEKQIAMGLTYDKIFLAGFSQGGAMALYTALHIEAKLAGVIALSAYLPLSQSCKTLLNKATPFFLAGGKGDTVVLPAWTQFAKNWIENAGYSQLAWHEYPMAHSICLQEIQDLSTWMTTQLKGSYDYR